MIHIDGTITVEASHPNDVSIQLVDVMATTIKLVFQSRLRTFEDEDAILSAVRFLEDRGWEAKIENSNSHRKFY